MPEQCKTLFQLSMDGDADYGSDWSDEEREFLFDSETKEPIKRTFEDFTVGLKVPGKLIPKRIRGGVLLKETPYEMR